MFRDIVIPNNNEKEFAEMASRLGYKRLYFLYDFNEYKDEIQKVLERLGIDFEVWFIVNKKNIGNASKKSKLLVAKSSADDRSLIESKKVRLIYGFEEIKRKDYLHQRASGLNHILCDIASINNVVAGFSYSSLLNKNLQLSSVLIGRMIQNISLCQKYKVKMIVGSFSSNPYEMRAPHDLASLFGILGMSGDKIKKAFTSDL